MYVVDLFLKSVNPDKARAKARVFSVDVPRGRRYTPKALVYTADADKDNTTISTAKTIRCARKTLVLSLDFLVATTSSPKRLIQQRLLRHPST